MRLEQMDEIEPQSLLDVLKKAVSNETDELLSTPRCGPLGYSLEKREVASIRLTKLDDAEPAIFAKLDRPWGAVEEPPAQVNQSLVVSEGSDVIVVLVCRERAVIDLSFIEGRQKIEYEDCRIDRMSQGA